jgi:hypothetical protein
MKQSVEQLQLLQKAKGELEAQLKDTKPQEILIDFALKVDQDPKKTTTPVDEVEDIKKKTQIHQTQKPKEKDYFEFIPTAMTPELQRELHIIKNRHVLDPKRHYKRQDKFSSQIQFGEIIPGVEDKRQRVRSITREMLQDDYYKGYVKRRMGEVHTLRNNVTRKGHKKKRRN